MSLAEALGTKDDSFISRDDDVIEVEVDIDDSESPREVLVRKEAPPTEKRGATASLALVAKTKALKAGATHITAAIDKMVDLVDDLDADNIAASRAVLAAKHATFVDVTFPPVGSTEWRRMEELATKVEPQNVERGSAWLMAVVSAVPTELIQRCLETTDETESWGLYRVWLCHGGTWRGIIVDDYVPWSVGPLFGTGDLGAMVIEKAAAKLRGGYDRLGDASVGDALVDVTGAPTVTYSVDEPLLKRHLQDGTFLTFLKANDVLDDGKIIIICAPPPTTTAAAKKKNAYSVMSSSENGLVRLRKGHDEDTLLDMDEFRRLAQRLTMCIPRGPNGRPWAEVRRRGSFVLTKRPAVMYKLTLERSSATYVMVHQSDARVQGAPPKYSDLAMTVLRYDKERKTLVYHSSVSPAVERQVICPAPRLDAINTRWPAGQYLVVAFSAECRGLRQPRKAGRSAWPDEPGVLRMAVTEVFDRVDNGLKGFLDEKDINRFHAHVSVDGLPSAEKCTLSQFRNWLLASGDAPAVLRAFGYEPGPTPRDPPTLTTRLPIVVSAHADDASGLRLDEANVHDSRAAKDIIDRAHTESVFHSPGNSTRIHRTKLVETCVAHAPGGRGISIAARCLHTKGHVRIVVDATKSHNCSARGSSSLYFDDVLAPGEKKIIMHLAPQTVGLWKTSFSVECTVVKAPSLFCVSKSLPMTITNLPSGPRVEEETTSPPQLPAAIIVTTSAYSVKYSVTKYDNPRQAFAVFAGNPFHATAILFVRVIKDNKVSYQIRKTYGTKRGVAAIKSHFGTSILPSFIPQNYRVVPSRKTRSQSMPPPSQDQHQQQLPSADV